MYLSGRRKARQRVVQNVRAKLGIGTMLFSLIIVCLTVDVVNSQGSCRLSLVSKRQCGRTGIARSDCEGRGCCYDGGSTHPRLMCYFRARLLGFESQETSQLQPPSTPSPTPRSATMTALQVFAMLQNQGVNARTALALIYEELYGINSFTLLTLWREFGTNYLYLLFVSNQAANRTVNPNSPRLLFAGGEPGYPGSQVLNTCNPANIGNTCGNPAYTTRGSCIRWKCCWDASTRTCYHATNNVIYLRQRCRPGFRNPPKCEDIDECLSNPCQNGGICTNLLNGYRCNCLSSIAGPNCENKCQSPPTLLNGGYTPIRTPPIYNINEIITYTCNQNYALQGGNTVVCLSTGQFTVLSASCVQGCPRPPDIPNGVITPADAYIAVGSAVTYTCNTDYTFNPQGTYKLACPPTQIFTVPSTNTCQKNCQTAPPPSANGVAPTYNPPSTTSFSPGTTATYTCGPNYAFPLGTVATLTCSTTGTWSSATAPTCAQGCPRPANILNGAITPADASIPVGGSITYTCNPGYTFNPAGQAVLTCPSTLSFVVPPGNICFKNCQTAPPAGTNGSPPGYSTSIISGSNTYSPGTNAIYSCNANFAFPSTVSNTLTCLTTGLWSANVAPACVSACPRPPDIPNGIIQPPDLFIAVGSTVTYSCLQGHTFNSAGTATLTCPASLSFVVPTENTCQPNCYSAPQKTANTGDPSYNNPPVVVGNLNTYLASTTATYTCIQGYVFPTGVTGTLTCTPSGMWNPQNAPNCVTAISCTSAPADSCCNTPVYSNNPISGSQRYIVGTTATYTCNQGSQIAGGNDFITCMANGQWSPSTAPSCFQGCDPAPSGTNTNPTIVYSTTVNSGKYKSGTTATYTCVGQTAFLPNVNNFITCNAGTWNPSTAPACETVCQAAPTELTNGVAPTYIPTSVTISGNARYRQTTVATYTCNTNFNFASGVPDTLTCNGPAWSGNAPLCEQVCNDAPAAVNSNGNAPSYAPAVVVVGSTNTYKKSTVATYTCKTSFAFGAGVSATLTCGSVSVGAWQPTTAPECIAVCGSAPAAANANGQQPSYSSAAISTNMYQSGTVATYNCLTNFAIAAGTPNTLTCQSGSWNPTTAPTCVAVCDAAPTQSANGIAPTYSTSAISSKYKSGTVATYTCQATAVFLPAVTDTLTCSNGDWKLGSLTATAAPVCTIACTTAPTQLANGNAPTYSTTEIVSGRYAANTIATYTCQTGFGFNNDHITTSTIQCSSTGTWNPTTAPQCVSVCGTPLCRNGQTCVGSTCLCDTNGGTFCEWKSLGGGQFYRVLSTSVTSFTDAVTACQSLSSTLLAPTVATNIRVNFEGTVGTVVPALTSNGWIHVTRSSSTQPWLYSGSQQITGSETLDFCNPPASTDLCAVYILSTRCWTGVSCSAVTAQPICYTTSPSG
ncbi:sushi, von Willebrand factor type A, EGF and pentraxin domain-containing protein 1-like isoform X4 [Ciona intestinalis]